MADPANDRKSLGDGTFYVSGDTEDAPGDPSTDDVGEVVRMLKLLTESVDQAEQRLVEEIRSLRCSPCSPNYSESSCAASPKSKEPRSDRLNVASGFFNIGSGGFSSTPRASTTVASVASLAIPSSTNHSRRPSAMASNRSSVASFAFPSSNKDSRTTSRRSSAAQPRISVMSELSGLSGMRNSGMSTTSASSLTHSFTQLERNLGVDVILNSFEFKKHLPAGKLGAPSGPHSQRSSVSVPKTGEAWETSESQEGKTKTPLRVTRIDSMAVTSSDEDGQASLSVLRQDRQSQLLALKQIEYLDEQIDAGSADAFWLRMCGVLPLPLTFWVGNYPGELCCKNANRLLILGLFASCVAVSFFKFVLLQPDKRMKQTCATAMCLKDVILPVMALGLGCCCRLLLFFLSEHQTGSHDVLLTHHLASIGASEKWKLQSRRLMAKLVLCWVFMIGLCIYTLRDWHLHVSWTIASVAMLAAITNVFFAFAHGIVDTCCCLDLGIDNFCSKIFRDHDCERAIEDWNTLQAVIRRVCISISHSFIILLTSSLTAMFLPYLFHDKVVGMLPGAFALLVLLWVSLFVGEVTSKCERVPVFINTLHFGASFDPARQYVVDYISNSRAGFYMFDVRVTGEMVVKFAYVGFMLAAAIVTQSVSNSED